MILDILETFFTVPFGTPGPHGSHMCRVKGSSGILSATFESRGTEAFLTLLNQSSNLIAQRTLKR